MEDYRTQFDGTSEQINCASMVQMVQESVSRQPDTRAEQFERLRKLPGQPAWLFSVREAALARFNELGFPTLRDEDWRFTNVAPIANLPFRPVLQPSPQDLAPGFIAGLTFGRLPAIRLVFVNGHYAPALSSSGVQTKGANIRSLAAALAEDTSWIEQYFGRKTAGSDDADAFSSLNTAFFQDGALVRIRAGTTLEEPIHLLFITTAREAGAAIHPRNLIIAEAGSRATILETYASGVEAPTLTNAVTDLVLHDGAALEHCKLQDEGLNAFHVAGLHAHLARSSNLISHSIAIGSKLSRNNIRAHLAGEGAECILNGLYLTRQDQLADHHMVVEHAQPHCNSHEYFNGILDGHSKGVFHGRILVRQPAQKTDAKQTNKNLLLSEDATVDTKPQLEIYADDVKCTHGATVGQLNEESVFYLRARGIGRERARRMLIHAFAGEIIERIRCAPVREELSRAVWDRLDATSLAEG